MSRNSMSCAIREPFSLPQVGLGSESVLDFDHVVQTANERFDAVLVELPPDQLVNLGDGVLVGPFPPIGALAGERVEYICYCNDPSFDRDIIPGDTGRVSRAINILVVKGDDVPSYADLRNDVEIERLGDRIDNRDTFGHVKFHLGHLVVGQLSRLEQNIVWNSNLADVVKRGKPKNMFDEF